MPSYDPMTELLGKHFALYPSARITEATVPAWREEFGGVDLDVLRAALSRARQHSPQFAPTSAMVQEAVTVEIAERVHAARQRLREPVGYIEPPEPQPGDNPGLKKAHEWREESQRLGINGVTPAEIAKRRFSELQEMLDNVGEA